MNFEDTLFAPPSKPTSAPRVQKFADVALKELRFGEGEASLLSDRGKFSEFMYRINESVLLGRNDPPTAASVIKIDEDAEKQDVHAIFETPSSTESSPARIDSVHQRDGAANATIPGQAEASALSWATLYRNRSASECARSRLHLSRRDKSKVRFNVGDGDHHNHVEQGSGTAPERHDRCYVDRLDSLKLRDGVTEKEHSWRHDNDGSNLLKELRKWRTFATDELDERDQSAREGHSASPSTLPPPPLPRASPPTQGTRQPLPPAQTTSPKDSCAHLRAEASSLATLYGSENGSRAVPTAKQGVRSWGIRQATPMVKDPFMKERRAPGNLEESGGTRVARENVRTEESVFKSSTASHRYSAGSMPARRQGENSSATGCAVDRGFARFTGGGGEGIREDMEEVSLDLSDCNDEKLSHLLRRTLRGQGS